MQVYIRPKKILLGSSLAFNLKEGPVSCAKVCNKSWVILKTLYEALNDKISGLKSVKMKKPSIQRELEALK